MSIAAHIGINIPRWMDDAACTTENPDDFFPRPGENVTYAKSVCARCPVATQCLAEALTDPGIDGVWGGTTGYERMKMRRGGAA